MSFISNQWLKGRYRLRNRGFRPVPVSLGLGACWGDWCHGKDVVASLMATQENGDFHCLNISKHDLAKLLPPLAQSADLSTREKVAMDFLISIEDATLLQFLNRLLAQRQGNELE